MKTLRLDFLAGGRVLALAAFLFLAAGTALAQKGPSTATTTIKVGGHPLRVEVVANDEDRAKGLMFREKLGRDDGMLFVFPELAYHAMWMKNTLIPLSVAFIEADGTIANIADMKPHDESSHCAVKPVPYALEMDRGWFAARGLKAGSRIGGLEKAPPRR